VYKDARPEQPVFKLIHHVASFSFSNEDVMMISQREAKNEELLKSANKKSFVHLPQGSQA
jgi:hypothetical protein